MQQTNRLLSGLRPFTIKIRGVRVDGREGLFLSYTGYFAILDILLDNLNIRATTSQTPVLRLKNVLPIIRRFRYSMNSFRILCEETVIKVPIESERSG